MHLPSAPTGPPTPSFTPSGSPFIRLSLLRQLCPALRYCFSPVLGCCGAGLCATSGTAPGISWRRPFGVGVAMLLLGPRLSGRDSALCVRSRQKRGVGPGNGYALPRALNLRRELPRGCNARYNAHIQLQFPFSLTFSFFLFPLLPLPRRLRSQAGLPLAVSGPPPYKHLAGLTCHKSKGKSIFFPQAPQKSKNRRLRRQEEESVVSA